MLLDRQLLRQTRPHRLALVITTCCGILCAGLIVLQARLTAGIIDSIFLSGVPYRSLSTPLILLIVTILFRGLFQFLTESISARMGIGIKEHLREVLIQKINRLGPVFTAGEKSGELAITLTEGIEELDPYFSQYLPQLIQAGFVPLIIAVSILPTDLLSFVLLFLTAPLLPVFMYLLGSMAEKSTQRQWQWLVRLGAHFYDTIQGLQLLKSINKSQSRGEEIQQNNDRYRHLTMNVLKLTFLSSFMLEFIATISTAVIAVEIGLRLLSGNLQFINALFILLLAPEFYLPLRQLGLKFHAGMSGRSASLRIFQILDMDETTYRSLESVSALQAVNPEQFDFDNIDTFFPITFNNVYAKYPGMDDFILKDISFRLNRFEKVALVGRSGVGKTTLSYVFMHLLDHYQGKIYFGKYSIQEIPRENFKKMISWVPQSPYIFTGNILQNISLFQPNVDKTRIRQAAQVARLDKFISQLPEGYLTQVGERGSQISTGQAQRLAIARAFYRDTPIIVMDEPTSSVDPETEQALMESVSALQLNKTMLIIAHRLSTISTCDQILVLDQGEIVEKGKHSDLLALKKRYFGLLSGLDHELD